MNYIKNISKQKVTSERTFIYMKKNDESVSEEEIQKTIATLISLNRLEERGIGTKSYFIPSLPDNVLTPQNFSENLIIDETNAIIDNTQKDENLDDLLKESRLHRIEEAIIANSNVLKVSLLSVMVLRLHRVLLWIF